MNNADDYRKVLAEFCKDIEAVGVDRLRDDPANPSDHQWPDLLQTYQKAKHLMGEKTESELIRESYEKAECPDCGNPIAEWVVGGDECINCGHVFTEYTPCDD